MHQYTCPKCKTILKRQEPVPAGKKIKCPKCENVFVPEAAVEAAKPAAAKGGRSTEDDYDRTPYLVAGDDDENDTVKAEKQRAAMGLVRDRFVKSKRGPAQGKVVQPANLMMASGVIIALISVITFVVGLFPLVFRAYYLDTPEYKKMSEAAQQTYWNEIVVIRAIIMAGATISFINASLICVGAFKMRTLESYAWGMTGAILCTLLGGIFIVIGIWCIVTLRDRAVIEGFAEEPPDM